MADAGEGPDAGVKHPLQHSWVLHYDAGTYVNKQKGLTEWKEQLQKVATISSVEDFWGVLNNIPTPAQLAPGANYYFFKEQCYPEMENEANKDGGKWQVVTGGAKTPAREKLNDMFLNVVRMWPSAALAACVRHVGSESRRALTTSPTATRGRTRAIHRAVADADGW